MKVLVVGASGVLGQQVIPRLLAHGVAVRAMTRRPAAAEAWARPGVEVVAGDLVDTLSLQRACTGVDRVLAAAHGMLGRGRYRSESVDGTGQRALIDAARAAGVQRFVQLSAMGASAEHPIDFFRSKYAAEQYLQQSGLPNVVLRPSAFMEWHAHEFNGKGLLAKGKAQLLGPGTKRRNFVAAGDVAELAVRALLGEPSPGPVMAIGGPGNYSNNEVAAIYAQAAGLPLRISHLPAPLLGLIARLAKPLHPGIARIMQMSSLPDDAFDESFDGSAALEQKYGLALTTLESFVQQQVGLAKGIKPG